jgi:hypothetical protein
VLFEANSTPLYTLAEISDPGISQILFLFSFSRKGRNRRTCTLTSYFFALRLLAILKLQKYP